MPGSGTIYIKDPAAKKDYKIDWTKWLATVADTIATSTWTSDAGITISTNPAASHDDTSATVWLSGGTAGHSYTVTNHITTVGGRIDEQSITLEVRDL